MDVSTRSSLPLARMGPSRGFSADARFAFGPGARMAKEPEADPVEDAYRRGLAQGREEALAEAAHDQAIRDAARERIELALAEFGEQELTERRERLRQTVLALCEASIAPLAIDPDGLTARIEKASAMLQRAQDERRVLLNPEDHAAIAGRLPPGFATLPDPSVERGGLRIETDDGGIEDGPSQWRRILEEAFREC